MKSSSFLNHKALRFRKWSRKGYAAFISTTHCVTIGQLASWIVERLDNKRTQKVVTSFFNDLTIADEDEKDLVQEEDFIRMDGLCFDHTLSKLSNFYDKTLKTKRFSTITIKTAVYLLH